MRVSRLLGCCRMSRQAVNVRPRARDRVQVRDQIPQECLAGLQGLRASAVVRAPADDGAKFRELLSPKRWGLPVHRLRKRQAYSAHAFAGDIEEGGAIR